MCRYENRFFTDFSFNLVDTVANTSLKNRFSEPIVKNRTMYGSDYWVVIPKNDLKEAIENHITTMGDDIFSMTNAVPDAFLFGKDLGNNTFSEMIAGL